MVKNLHGGNKHKNQARKNVDSASSYNKLIISKQPDEVYAIVTCLLGGNKCQVMTLQQKPLLCVIGGKFYKREFVRKGTWVLVGLREWDNSKTIVSNKKQQCDLLEIYNEQNKIDLKNTVIDVNWKIFLDVDSHSNNNNNNNQKNKNDEDDFIEFTNQENDSYKELMERQINADSVLTTIKLLQQKQLEEEGGEEEEINIDDI